MSKRGGGKGNPGMGSIQNHRPAKHDSGEQIVQVSRSTVVHSGPLPSVEAFKAYGEVVQSAPERILAMAEKEQDARIAADHFALQENASIAKRGQMFGAGISYISIAVASVLIYLGHYWGTVLIIGTLNSIVPLFVNGGKKASKE